LDIIRFSDSSESAEEESKSSSEFSENWGEGDEYFDTGDPEMIVDESLPFSIFAEKLRDLGYVGCCLAVFLACSDHCRTDVDISRTEWIRIMDDHWALSSLAGLTEWKKIT
jgi:hypothetical protein